MIDKAWAIDFAERWIAAWNSHDLTRIFDLYDDEFTMMSPYIVTRESVASGILTGKQRVEPYWRKALESPSQLTFILVDVFIGVDSVIVYYKSVGRCMVCETFRFNDLGKVISGCSSHGEPVEKLKGNNKN